MGVRQDDEGKYVTSDRPFKQYDHGWQAQNAESWQNACDASKSVSQPIQSYQTPQFTAVAGQSGLSTLFGYATIILTFWAILNFFILIPGLRASFLLQSAGGFFAIPGAGIGFILRVVHLILFAPYVFIYPWSDGDIAKQFFYQMGVIAVISIPALILWKKLKKTILYFTGALAILSYISVGLLALNNDLWASFEVYPFLN